MAAAKNVRVAVTLTGITRPRLPTMNLPSRRGIPLGRHSLIRGPAQHRIRKRCRSSASGECTLSGGTGEVEFADTYGAVLDRLQTGLREEVTNVGHGEVLDVTRDSARRHLAVTRDGDEGAAIRFED